MHSCFVILFLENIFLSLKNSTSELKNVLYKHKHLTLLSVGLKEHCRYFISSFHSHSPTIFALQLSRKTWLLSSSPSKLGRSSTAAEIQRLRFASSSYLLSLFSCFFYDFCFVSDQYTYMYKHVCHSFPDEIFFDLFAFGFYGFMSRVDRLLKFF